MVFELSFLVIQCYLFYFIFLSIELSQILQNNDLNYCFQRFKFYGSYRIWLSKGMLIFNDPQCQSCCFSCRATDAFFSSCILQDVVTNIISVILNRVNMISSGNYGSNSSMTSQEVAARLFNALKNYSEVSNNSFVHLLLIIFIVVIILTNSQSSLFIFYFYLTTFFPGVYQSPLFS